MKLKTRLIALTQPVEELAPITTPEELIVYCARVSNPANQNNTETAGGLIDYCIRNKHWSVFEMANAVVEVEAPRDITRQLLRHRSFSFQEFSQRYASAFDLTSRDFRSQDTKNRQNSIDDLPQDFKEFLGETLESFGESSMEIYQAMLEGGVAKECARVVLPEGLTMSRLYVNGTLRSWLHYLDVRDDPGVTQWEHVLLARAIREVLTPALPKLFSKEV